MKSKINLLFLSIAILIGSVSGILMNQETAYARSCEDLACKYDYLGGFRCFDDGTAGYGCDDSSYPSCSETRCDQLMEN
jgi:hypothetical protein